MNNIKHLKKLDSELWEDEIEGIEKQRSKQFENAIGYSDILDVKLIIIEAKE